MGELTSCPWCGQTPTIEPWHGGGPDKHLVHCCADCFANRSVVAETRAEAIDNWTEPLALYRAKAVLSALDDARETLKTACKSGQAWLRE